MRIHTTLILLILLAINNYAEGFLSSPAMTPPIIAITYDNEIINPSSTLKIGVDIPKGWKINSNKLVDEFLIPSSINATATGITFGKPIFPIPDTLYIKSLNMKNSVFQDSIVIQIPIKKMASNADPLSTTINFQYQACNNKICIAPTSITKSITEKSLFSNIEPQATISNSKSQAIDQVTQIDSSKTNSKSIASTTSIKLNKTNSITEKNILPNSDKKIKTNNFKNKLRSQALAGIDNLQKEPKSETENIPTPSLIYMLLLAFIGGLILNLMPCVLPVLSIKIMSLAKQSHESKARLISLSSMMTLGVLSSFWILSIIIISLKSAGENVGWGFQFQNTWFLISMILLMVIVSANLFGLFELILPGQSTSKMDNASKKEGFVGAFFTGVFMTLLSTPCSAPFLGVALGYAFIQPGYIIILFFSFIGLGLASPYMILSLFPKALRFMPKPGNWMILLRQFMAFPILLTALWLASVLAHSVSIDSIFYLSVIALIITLGLWIYGSFIQPKQLVIKSFVFLALLILIIGILINITLKPSLEITNQKSINTVLKNTKGKTDNLDAFIGQDKWLNWSPQIMNKVLQKEAIIFLDFTAEWCVTCKANEAAIINTNSTKKLFQENNVIKIKADWTKPSPEITKELQKFNRSGVPLYVVYSRKTKETLVLPEIITKNILFNAIKQASNN